MINSIIKASSEYIDSPEYERSFNAICNQFTLNEDNVGYLGSAIDSVILGTLDEKDFVEYLRDISDLNAVEAEQLFQRSKELVFTPFKTKLAKIVIDKQQEAFSDSRPINETDPISVTDKLLRKESIEEEELIKFTSPSPLPTPSRPQDPLNKDHILSQIENPPRTVVKRYVIEHAPDHDPITDPDHLIDDTIEQRAKLEAHYSNQ